LGWINLVGNISHMAGMKWKHSCAYLAYIHLAFYQYRLAVAGSAWYNLHLVPGGYARNGTCIIMDQENVIKLAYQILPLGIADGDVSC